MEFGRATEQKYRWFRAMIANFWLAWILTRTDKSKPASGNRGTFGYIAPGSRILQNVKNDYITP